MNRPGPILHRRPEDDPSGIAELVEEAARLLPEQAPLQAFVHHNPLHAFEHLPFEEAAVRAARLYGTEPFPSEDFFAQCLEAGRIRPEDLDAVAAAEGLDDETPIVPGGPTRRAFCALRLRHPFEIPQGAALEWTLQETDALERITGLAGPKRRAELLRQAQGDERRLLRRLWDDLEKAAPPQRPGAPSARRRDQILALTGVDTDRLVHPVLIRLVGAFLDQGVARRPMPGRRLGFLRAFRRLYGLRGGPPDRFLRGLAGELSRQEAEGWTAERTVAWALGRLAVPAGERAAVIRDTLLSLPGWAGMMRRLERHPQSAPVRAPAARLIDYLAVQLILDVQAARHAVTGHLGPHAAIADLDVLSAADASAGRRPDRELVYEAFVLAQVMPVDTAVLADRAAAAAWLAAVRACDAVERRRLLQLAHERRHRIEVLDALTAHQTIAARPVPPPRFQAVFCIDEREEALRRHLEEHFLHVETFGYAGSFGVAMLYRGMEDVRARPLCPAAVTPRHLVEEVAVTGTARRPQRLRDLWERQIAAGTRTPVRGWLLTLLLGLAHLLVLAARCLPPHRPRRTGRGGTGPRTRLALERPPGQGADGEDGPLRGYTVPEMTRIVSTVLRTIGLTGGLAPLVLIVGHGSSSLNNPHEAAHDCGAAGGGRGGPNARAFAAMADHPGVRRALRREGLHIPDDTWFVGACHDTCTDTITYYDEDLVPERCRGALRAAKRAMARACTLTAHERCRRFESVPADLPIGRAPAHVAGRAVDLGQPRPEYGHATNAVCIVGRRSRTRGLFLDRRAFLVSYDPGGDPTGELLADLLAAVGPVCAGINLEYYFSRIDPAGYGCGTKLPHNIAGLLGVMDGHASDLRTGLPWQMVEIHEPLRLLLVVEAAPQRLEAILRTRPDLGRLVTNGWIRLVAWDPDSAAMHVHDRGVFRPHVPQGAALPVVHRSVQFYAGARGHLGFAHVTAAFATGDGFLPLPGAAGRRS